MLGGFQQARVHQRPLLRRKSLHQHGHVRLPVRVQDAARVEASEVGRVLDHLGAQCLEYFYGVFHRHRHVAVDLVALDESERGRIGDAQSLHALLEALQVVLGIVGPAVEVAAVGSGDDVHHHRGVANGARHRPDVRESPLRRGRPQRHARLRGLQSEETGEGAGDAHRTRAVGADGEIAHADRFGRDAAAGGPTRRAAELPGIVRGAVEAGIGHALPAVFRRGRLAQQHRAGLAQALRHRRVDGPRPVGIGGEAAHARRHALGQHHVLDGERHAVEVALPLAAFFPALLRGACGTQRRVGIEMLEGVELAVEGIDARQRRLGGFDRRGLA